MPSEVNAATAPHWLPQPVRWLLALPWAAAITPWGWAVLCGACLTAWPAWIWGWAEFRIVFVACAVALVVAVLSVLGRREHEVLFQLARPRVRVGDVAAGQVLVRAAGGRASGSVTLEFPVADQVASFRVKALRPGETHHEPFTIPAERRGVLTLGPVRSVQTDPLMLLSRAKQLSHTSQLFVHPRLVLLEAGAVGFLRDVEGIATSNLSSSDVSFHALREYVPGDDRRSVHWRTTARTGTLMVRQFEETMRAHLLIVLSTRTSDYADEDDFELAVSAAASLGVSALRQDRQVTLCLSTGVVRFRGAIGLLDVLAGVRLGGSGGDLRQLAVLHGDEPGISVAAFITGTTAPSALRSAQLGLPPGIVTFAVRCQAGADLARRRVGDLAILDVPSLDDLRAGIRSVS